MRAGLVAFIGLALAGACGLAAPSPSPTGSPEEQPAATGEPLVRQSFGELTFQMPASWSLVRPWDGGLFGPKAWLTSASIASVCEPRQFYPRATCFVTSRKDLAPRTHWHETSAALGGGVVVAFISRRGPVEPFEVPATPAFFAQRTSLECKALGGNELVWVVRFMVIEACAGGPVAKRKVEDMVASIVVISQG